jgi:hypothetical protein
LEEESEGSLGGWWPGEEELNPDEDFLLEERPQAYNEAEVLLRRPDTSSSSSGQGGAGTSSSAGAQQQPQQQQGGQAAAAPSLPPHLGLEMLAQRLAAARVAPAGPASAAPSANVWDAGRIATFSGPPAAVRRSDHWLDGQSTLQNGMPLLHWQQARESGTCSVRQGLAVFHHRTHQVCDQWSSSLAACQYGRASRCSHQHNNTARLPTDAGLMQVVPHALLCAAGPLPDCRQPGITPTCSSRYD